MHSYNRTESYNRIKGYIFALAAGLFFGIMGFLIHAAEGVVPFSELAFARALLAFIVLCPFICINPPLFFTRDTLLIWIRGIAGGISMLCVYYTLQTLTIGTAKIIADLGIALTTILAYFILKEKVHAKAAFGIVLMFFSMVLLNSSEASAPPLNDLLIGLMGAVFAGIGFLSLRIVAQKHPSQQIVFISSLCIMLLSLLAPGAQWIMPQNLEQISFLLLVGLSGTVAQLSMTKANQYLEAGVAGSIVKSSILWAILLGIIFLSERPVLLEWLCYILFFIALFFLTSFPKPLKSNSA